MAIYEFDIIEPIAFVENIHSSLLSVSASDHLALFESADNNIRQTVASDSLFFFEDIIKGGIHQKLAVDAIEFQERVTPRSFNADIYEVLAISETVGKDNINEIIDFIETVDYQHGIGVVDLIELIETISHTSRRSYPVSESLILVEGAVGYKLDTCRLTEQINNHQVVFSRGADIIIFPAPQFGNVERFDWTRVSDRTRGGDLIVFRDSNWPKAKSFLFRWVALPYELRANMILFMRRNLGKILTMIDYEGRSFNGIISNPEADFIDQGRCKQEVQLQFEVE